MPYVKKDGVVKKVESHVVSNYLSLGWKLLSKSDYEKNAPAPKIKSK